MSFEDSIKAYGNSTGSPWAAPPPRSPVAPLSASVLVGADERKVNRKGLLADVANWGQTIDKDFRDFQTHLNSRWPKLLDLEGRAQLFLRQLQALSQGNNMRIPGMRREREAILKDYESLQSVGRIGHLRGYRRTYLPEWVLPLVSTAASTSSRVHFIQQIQSGLEKKADGYYADLRRFRNQIISYETLSQNVGALLDEIDVCIAGFASKELPSDLLEFAADVKREMAAGLAKTFSEELVKVIALCSEVDDQMGTLRSAIERTIRWLHHPEMPKETVKEDQPRQVSRQSLQLMKDEYTAKGIDKLKIEGKDFKKLLEEAITFFKTFQSGDREGTNSANGAAAGVIVRLESRLTMFVAATKTFQEFKEKACAKYADIERCISARKQESEPAQLSLRQKILEKQKKDDTNTKGWGSYLGPILSWRMRFSHSPSSAPKNSEAGLGKQLEAVDWTNRRLIDCRKKDLEQLLPDDAKRKALLPPAELQRDLKNIAPDQMLLEDYWTHALKECWNLSVEQLKKNPSGANLLVRFRLLQSFKGKLDESVKPFVQVLYMQLREDCQNYQKNFQKPSAFHQAEIRRYRERLAEGLKGNPASLSALTDERRAAVGRVIEQLDQLQALIKADGEQFEQVGQILSWIKENEKLRGECVLDIKDSEDPFGAKPLAVPPAPVGKMEAIQPRAASENLIQPLGLWERFQRHGWTENPDLFLKNIEKTLPILIETVKNWEEEKLRYHELAFGRICRHIRRIEHQVIQLVANIRHLEQTAQAIETLYASVPNPLPQKSAMLFEQLRVLRDYQEKIAEDVAVCRARLPKCVDLLEKMANEAGLKLIEEKLKWRKQQEGYLTRSLEGNQKRKEQLERAKAKYGFAAKELQLMWKIAEDAYKVAEKHVESLNYRQNATPGKRWGYWPPSLLHVNPFSKEHPVPVGLPSLKEPSAEGPAVPVAAEVPSAKQPVAGVVSSPAPAAAASVKQPVAAVVSSPAPAAASAKQPVAGVVSAPAPAAKEQKPPVK